MSEQTESDSSNIPDCPVGEKQCPVVEELLALRSENRQLALESRTDHLTGLANHRHFRDVLEREMERTRRSGIPMALIIADLDHFKALNDRYGHEAGNRALQRAADAVSGTLRKIDIPCRYGGEEFAVILPGESLPNAAGVAERLRGLVEGIDLVIEGEAVPLTASFGVAAYDGSRALSGEALVAEADQWLYEAKGTGRNRVCHAPIEQSGSSSQVSQEERSALFS